jgi:hypothetical protein
MIVGGIFVTGAAGYALDASDDADNVVDGPGPEEPLDPTPGTTTTGTTTTGTTATGATSTSSTASTGT